MKEKQRFQVVSITGYIALTLLFASLSACRNVAAGSASQLAAAGTVHSIQPTQNSAEITDQGQDNQEADLLSGNGHPSAAAHGKVSEDHRQQEQPVVDAPAPDEHVSQVPTRHDAADHRRNGKATPLSAIDIEGGERGDHDPESEHAGQNVGSSTSFGEVEILIDNAQEYQSMAGFGATHSSLVYEGLGDVLGPTLRAEAVEAAYGQVGLNLGNLEGALLESPGGYDLRRNDNDDPLAINWSGFQTFAADAMKEQLLDQAEPYGFEDYYVNQSVNIRWASPWLEEIRSSDYDRYLDEVAEQMAAGQIYWRDTYGIVPEWQMPFNEPLSGGKTLPDGTVQEVVDIVKRAGGRLESEGFAGPQFVAPNEETTVKTLQTATAILTDPQAKQYMGAIGYHSYPYGSVYASIPRILSTSGAGNPDANAIARRVQLKELGQQYGFPVWMTEVSHGGVHPLSFDSLRGRAIHIHDELVYANASGYFGMLNMWDTISQQEHFGNNDLFDFDNEGNVVFIDTDTETVHISGMGFAIGHYARWIERGALRIEATSDDSLVQVTAFRDDDQGQLVLVVINNAALARNVTVSLNDLTLDGNLNGEQSTDAARWQPLAPFPPTSPSTFTLEAPAESVTTISGQFNSTAPNEPDIDVSPASLNFGLVLMGNFADETVTINNKGAQPLTVSNLATTNNVFTVTSPTAPFDVAAGGSRMVTVRFSPTITGKQTGDLDIASNDPDENLVSVALSGEGVDLPSVEPCLGEVVGHGSDEWLGPVARSEPPFCVFLPLLQK